MLDSKITGFNEAEKLLKQLPKRTQERVLQRATTETLKETALYPIKNNAPRHNGERSKASKEYGTLFSNIRVARLRKVKRGEKGSRIHTGRAFWGYIIEKGSRYIPAQPWFAPKFRSLQGVMFKVLGNKIGFGIEKEVNKLYKGRK